MNIVILMAGSSQDFIDKGHFYPKYLLEIQNEPIIQRVINSLSEIGGSLSFIIRKEDYEKFFLGNAIKILAPESSVIVVESLTKGAVCTMLFAIDQINNENELLILNGDQLIRRDINEALDNFRKRDLDGGIVVFRSVHPRWSYVVLDESDLVMQTSEKRPISNIAAAGCYYYKKGSDFVRSALSVIRKDVNYQGNYYTSSTYNELILEQKKIGVYEIPKDNYISFSSYQMYENYLNHRKD
ncbi:glycosyltransferase family 2 protein [Parabacteroides goldsteinii]|uniref:glycosyltransferase family 2 protein n=1 Tax=Parabacteroides goldsteinii TaxID=328812 RepID=UPI002A8253B5|nr:glycosyltransferase family 2 protein [Parabacteroides goldsteinii]